VALPADDLALAAWQTAHPQGVIFGQPNDVSLPWAPHAEILFHDDAYAIWYVADAPLAPPAS
jgi:hypothetical protein